MRLRAVLQSSISARVVALGISLALAQLVVAAVVADGGATGHAWYHILFFALPALAVAALIVVRWPTAGSATHFPVFGLLALATAQFIESVGAMGFDSTNEARVGDIVVLHDLGLGLTAIGMVAAVVGLAAGVGIAAWRLDGRRRWLGLAAALIVSSGGLVLVLALTGMVPLGG